MKFDIYAINAIADICASTSVTDDNKLLLQKLADIYPDLPFVHVLTRGGWHRTGGVLNNEAKRVADKLSDWVELKINGNINKFIDEYADAHYIATILTGETYYFVAQTGDTAKDFIQLEVEVLQEVHDHILLGNNASPDDIEDIVNPIDIEKLPSKLVDRSYYMFRRITPISDYMLTMSEGSRPDDKLVTMRRFMQDWDRSSAKEIGPFCFHWVLSLQEYTDAYGEPIIQAKPVSAFSGELPILRLDDAKHGSQLANLIHGFDNNIGFPMAWYFYMLSHSEVPHQLAEAIHKDLMGAYDYLPLKDLKVVNDWYEIPYGI